VPDIEHVKLDEKVIVGVIDDDKVVDPDCVLVAVVVTDIEAETEPDIEGVTGDEVTEEVPDSETVTEPVPDTDKEILDEKVTDDVIDADKLVVPVCVLVALVVTDSEAKTEPDKEGLTGDGVTEEVTDSDAVTELDKEGLTGD
jgi:hypothetical protein